MTSLDSFLQSLRQSSLKRNSHASTNTSVVPPDIFQLERQRDHFHAIRDYGAAQHLDNRLQELKRLHEDRRMQELELQQDEEMAGSDASFQQACGHLMVTWQQRIRQLHEQLQDAEQQLLARQEEEFTALMEAQTAVQPRPKYSPALLNMRHIERSLAIQKEFVKADKVKQQADQLELLELSQMGAERAGKFEAEQSRLVAQHCKEREAAATKATSALMAVQQRQDYEVEQLTRRYQAIKLSLSRSHAAERLSLQQSLRGCLGLSKPSHLLGLPSFNSSLTETRGLVPESVPLSTGFDTPTSPIAAKLASCQGGDSISSSPGSRCRSPPYELPSPVHPARRSVSPTSPLGGRRRQAAAAQAAAAAAGLGMGSMPPLTPHRSASSAAAAAAQKVYGAPGLRHDGSDGGSSSGGGRPCTRGSLGMSSSRIRPSGSGAGAGASILPAAAGAVSLDQPRPGTRRAGDLRASWSPSSSSQLNNIKDEVRSDSKHSSVRATTSHSKIRPPVFAASAAVNSVSCASSTSSIGPWCVTTGVPHSAQQAVQQQTTGAASLEGSLHSMLQHTLLDAVPVEPGADGEATFVANAAPSAVVDGSKQQLEEAVSGQQEVQEQQQDQQRGSEQVAGHEAAATEAAGASPELSQTEASLAAGGAVASALNCHLGSAEIAPAHSAKQGQSAAPSATGSMAQVAPASAEQQAAATHALCEQSEERLAVDGGSVSSCELRAEEAAVGSGLESSIEAESGGQQPLGESASDFGDCEDAVASASIAVCSTAATDRTCDGDVAGSDAPLGGVPA